MNGLSWTPKNSCYSCWQWVACSVRWSSRNSSDPRWMGREAGHCLPGGTLLVSFRLPPHTCQPCMSTLYVNLVCQPCMYVCTLPTSSSHFLFPLFYPLPYTHTSHSPLTLPTLTLLTLTPHTSPSPSPPHSFLTLLTLTLTLTLTHHHTPHTPHTDTKNVFHLMVWVLDDGQKKHLHPLTPSHSHIGQSWSGYGQSFILQ